MRTRGPGESALLLLDALAVVTSERVTYAVIGAMAASVHGVVRASMDADVIMAMAIPRLRDLQRRFTDAARAAVLFFIALARNTCAKDVDSGTLEHRAVGP
jgi:tetrahydromethanopterin S-methyltransferase subunit C